MKKQMMSIILTGSLLSISALCLADSGPAEMDLKAKYAIEGKKAAVVFPHKLHQEKLDCVKCHDSDQGGALTVKAEFMTGMKNDFHKKICWPCHVEMKVPKGKSCSTCHKKK